MKIARLNNHTRRRLLVAAAAATALQAMATRATPRDRTEVATAFADPGPQRSSVVDVEWTDAARTRTLPLRVRVPEHASSTAPAALVLFSHGLGGSVEAGRFWAEHWASHGIAVIHLQHPGSDAAVWQGAQNRAAAARAMKSAAELPQFLARVADVKFVLDELARRRQAGDAMVQRLDLARIGMSGHSFGAVTTQALAGQQFPVGRRQAAQADALADERLRAFIAFSPSARSDEAAPQFARITRPFFSVTGTEDGRVGLGLGVPPQQRLIPFEGMPGPEAYLLNLVGADHATFSGQPRWRDEPATDPARDDLHRRLVKATTLAFWQAQLADDAAARAWLHGSARQFVGADGDFRSKS
jgi:predicted dienelactone hydrolase